LAGQILAEAAIGLSLMVFVWIIVSYVNYMCNNRIRTNMAARFSAWLSGNGVDPTASGYLAPYFFLNNDTNLVAATSVQNNLSFLGVSVPSIIVPDPIIYSNSVTFGTNTVDSSSPFPFNMLTVHVPFMPDMLTNFTMVSAHCAWPDVSNTYNSFLPPAISALALAEAGWTAGIFATAAPE
jgi:hypothetical protein